MTPLVVPARAPHRSDGHPVMTWTATIFFNDDAGGVYRRLHADRELPQRVHGHRRSVQETTATIFEGIQGSIRSKAATST